MQAAAAVAAVLLAAVLVLVVTEVVLVMNAVLAVIHTGVVRGPMYQRNSNNTSSRRAVRAMHHLTTI